VLLPGLDGTGALFERFVRAAPAGLRLQLASLPAEPIGYLELSRHLEADLSLSRDDVLLAESFSGPLAMYLAAKHKVAQLVLCNTFARPPLPRFLRSFARPALFRIPPPAVLIRRYLLGLDATDTLVRQVRGVIASVPPEVLSARVRAVLSVDAAGWLAQCSMPILYLRSTEDHLVSDASVVALVAAASVPVSVSRVPGPHLLLQAAPERVWSAISQALLQLPAA